MTNNGNRITDEFAKLMTGAADAAQNIQREVEGAFRAQGEKWLNTMDIVQREEFDALRDMVVQLSERNTELTAQLNELQSKLSADTKAKPGKNIDDA